MVMYGICAHLVQLIFQLLKMFFEKMQFDNALPNKHKGSFVEMNICRSTCI